MNEELDENGWPVPGEGRVTTEVRHVNGNVICRNCGTICAPQVMRVHFESFWSIMLRIWLWRVSGYTHTYCEGESDG